MTSPLQRMLIILGGIIAVGFIGYTAFWFWMAGEINRQVRYVITDWAEAGIAFNGEIGKVRGYPGRPIIDFHGILNTPTAIVDVGKGSFEGFPALNQTWEITLEEGFRLTNPALPEQTLQAEYAQAVLYIKGPYIRDLTRPEIAAWQEKGGRIYLSDLVIQQYVSRIEGFGELYLNEQLQPTGALNLQIIGIADFLSRMREDGLISESNAQTATNLVKLMGANMSAPGAAADLSLTLSIQDNVLRVGMFPLARLPVAVWPEGRSARQRTIQVAPDTPVTPVAPVVVDDGPLMPMPGE